MALDLERDESLFEEGLGLERIKVEGVAVKEAMEKEEEEEWRA